MKIIKLIVIFLCTSLNFIFGDEMPLAPNSFSADDFRDIGNYPGTIAGDVIYMKSDKYTDYDWNEYQLQPSNNIITLENDWVITAKISNKSNVKNGGLVRDGYDDDMEPKNKTAVWMAFRGYNPRFGYESDIIYISLANKNGKLQIETEDEIKDTETSRKISSKEIYVKFNYEKNSKKLTYSYSLNNKNYTKLGVADLKNKGIESPYVSFGGESRNVEMVEEVYVSDITLSEYNWILYDNFNSNNLDRSLWDTGRKYGGNDPYVEDGALVLSSSKTSRNKSGYEWNGMLPEINQSLIRLKETQIKAVKFDVTIIDIENNDNKSVVAGVYGNHSKSNLNSLEHDSGNFEVFSAEVFRSQDGATYEFISQTDTHKYSSNHYYGDTAPDASAKDNLENSTNTITYYFNEPNADTNGTLSTKINNNTILSEYEVYGNPSEILIQASASSPSNMATFDNSQGNYLYNSDNSFKILIDNVYILLADKTPTFSNKLSGKHFTTDEGGAEVYYSIDKNLNVKLGYKNHLLGTGNLKGFKYVGDNTFRQTEEYEIDEIIFTSKNSGYIREIDLYTDSYGFRYPQIEADDSDKLAFKASKPRKLVPNKKWQLNETFKDNSYKKNWATYTTPKGGEFVRSETREGLYYKSSHKINYNDAPPGSDYDDSELLYTSHFPLNKSWQCDTRLINNLSSKIPISSENGNDNPHDRKISVQFSSEDALSYKEGQNWFDFEIYLMRDAYSVHDGLNSNAEDNNLLLVVRLDSESIEDSGISAIEAEYPLTGGIDSVYIRVENSASEAEIMILASEDNINFDEIVEIDLEDGSIDSTYLVPTWDWQTSSQVIISNLGGPLNQNAAQLGFEFDFQSTDDYIGDLGVEFVKAVELKDIDLQFSFMSGYYDGTSGDIDFEINGQEANFDIDLDDFPNGKGSRKITVPNEPFTIRAYTDDGFTSKVLKFNPKKSSRLKLALDGDSDGDGLNDSTEAKLKSDPYNTDSDGDGLDDYEEFSLGTSLILEDTDKDGLTDYEESVLQTNPKKADSDGDRMSDYDEYEAGTDPLDKRNFPAKVNCNISFARGVTTDADHVYVSVYKVDPNDSDSYIESMGDFSIAIAKNKATGSIALPAGYEYDFIPYAGDIIIDNEGYETHELTGGYKTLNLKKSGNLSFVLDGDSDGDGVTDSIEAKLKSDPYNTDSDGDGLDDYEEFSLGTSLILEDTDKDGVSDYMEILLSTDPKDRNDKPVTYIEREVLVLNDPEYGPSLNIYYNAEDTDSGTGEMAYFEEPVAISYIAKLLSSIAGNTIENGRLFIRTNWESGERRWIVRDSTEEIQVDVTKILNPIQINKSKSFGTYINAANDFENQYSENSSGGYLKSELIALSANKKSIGSINFSASGSHTFVYTDVSYEGEVIAFPLALRDTFMIMGSIEDKSKSDDTIMLEGYIALGEETLNVFGQEYSPGNDLREY